jgi:metal-responsive CopG/Arc/MetJ family transcriptional regulator
MTKIQAYFPEELYLEAQLVAKKEDTNFSELLRKIVQNYLNQKKPANTKKIKTVTFKNLGQTNAAITHNDIYDLK